MSYKLPDDFLWGGAVAAHQVEGGVQSGRQRTEYLRCALRPGLTHQCLYFEQPHTFEQILFIQTAEPALVGHA